MKEVMYMKTVMVLLALLVSSEATAKECSPLLDFEVRTLNGNTMVNLCEAYQGKVILVVNTASKCAYTNQYSALETLYGQYRDQGLVVLGFPSNDFGQQEPGTEAEVKTFCKMTYGVEFPMFAKTQVKKNNADPFYVALAAKAGRYPQWNFHKYLIDRKGNLVADYKSTNNPMQEPIISEIKKQLLQQ
jgi:glutathione peroxidase